MSGVSQRMRQMPCTINGCVDTLFCGGLCVLHYFRQKRHGSPTSAAKKWKPSSRRRHQVVTQANYAEGLKP